MATCVTRADSLEKSTARYASPCVLWYNLGLALVGTNQTSESVDKEKSPACKCSCCRAKSVAGAFHAFGTMGTGLGQGLDKEHLADVGC